MWILFLVTCLTSGVENGQFQTLCFSSGSVGGWGRCLLFISDAAVARHVLVQQIRSFSLVFYISLPKQSDLLLLSFWKHFQNRPTKKSDATFGCFRLSTCGQNNRPSYAVWLALSSLPLCLPFKDVTRHLKHTWCNNGFSSLSLPPSFFFFSSTSRLGVDGYVRIGLFLISGLTRSPRLPF